MSHELPLCIKVGARTLNLIFFITPDSNQCKPRYGFASLASTGIYFESTRVLKAKAKPQHVALTARLWWWQQTPQVAGVQRQHCNSGDSIAIPVTTSRQSRGQTSGYMVGISLSALHLRSRTLFGFSSEFASYKR